MKPPICLPFILTYANDSTYIPVHMFGCINTRIENFSCINTNDFSFPNFATKYIERMADVLLLRTPFEVIHAVVHFVSINMIYL